MVGGNTPVIELMHRPIDDSTWKDICCLCFPALVL